MSGETVSMSSSGNITMLIYNGNEEDCTYDKWERRLKCGLELKDVSYVLDDDFVNPTKTEAEADVDTGKPVKKRYLDNIKAKVLLKITTDDIANDLICDMELARDMKVKLDEEFKLGDKDYDLDHLFDLFEEEKLDIKTNPSVFFTNLNKINKKFDKFNEIDGKDYTRDEKELYIKICKSIAPEYKEVITAYKTNNVKLQNPKEKLEGLKAALKEFWKENYSALYQNGEKGNLIMNTNKNGGKICTHCHKKGHLESECWQKHGKPSKTGSTNSNERKCWKCGSTKHLKKDCPQRKKTETEVATESTAITGVFMGMALCSYVSSCTKDTKWLGDTGSQIHAMKSDDTELKNEKNLINEPVSGCNGGSLRATKTGDITIETKDGVRCELNNVRVVPGLAKDVISINQLRSEGWKLSEDHNGIMTLKLNEKVLRFLPGKEKHLLYLEAKVIDTTDIKKVHQTLTSSTDSDEESLPDLVMRHDETKRVTWADVVMNTTVPVVQDANIVSDDEDSVEDPTPTPTRDPMKNKNPTDKPTTKPMNESKTTPSIEVSDNTQSRFGERRLIGKDINEAHDQWGHHGERRLKEMARLLGYKLTGKQQPCDACGIAKATRARVSKTTNIQATKPGERLFVDTTGPFPNVTPKYKYLFGAVDDYSGKLFMMFGQSKKNLIKFVEQAFKRFEGEKKNVKYLRMDGGGENVAVKQLCNTKGVEVEQTPPYTPQYNGRIERRFPIIISMAMALLWAAGFVKEIKNKLFPQAVETAAFLHDLAPTARNSKGADELWSGKPNKWKGKYLIQFGRVGLVTIKSEKVGKLENKSEPMIMVGYAKEYPLGTYQFYNPKTKRIIVSDSVQWTDFSRWKITPELKDIFDVVKENNQSGLETYDELGLEHVLKQHMRHRISSAPTIKLEDVDTDTKLPPQPHTPPIEENVTDDVKEVTTPKTLTTTKNNSTAVEGVRRSTRLAELRNLKLLNQIQSKSSQMEKIK